VGKCYAPRFVLVRPVLDVEVRVLEYTAYKSA